MTQSKTMQGLLAALLLLLTAARSGVAATEPSEDPSTNECENGDAPGEQCSARGAVSRPATKEMEELHVNGVLDITGCTGT